MSAGRAGRTAWAVRSAAITDKLFKLRAAGRTDKIKHGHGVPQCTGFSPEGCFGACRRAYPGYIRRHNLKARASC